MEAGVCRLSRKEDKPSKGGACYLGGKKGMNEAEKGRKAMWKYGDVGGESDDDY